MSNKWDALNITPTDNRTAKDVLSEFYGKEYTNDDFADVFSKINAYDFAQAYQAGLIPTEKEARDAVKNGEYLKGSNDYIVEKLYDIFDIGDYNDPTGFVSKGATFENLHIPQMSENDLTSITSSPFKSNFAVGDVKYMYNPATGQITRKGDGKVVSGVDEINQYAKDNYKQFPDDKNYSGSSGYSPITGGTGKPTGSAEGGFFGNTSYTPGAGSAVGGSSGSSGGSTGGAPYNPGGNASAGGYPASGGSGTGKSGADVLADYLSSLSIDSDFSKNLNASRENLESKYGTLFEDIRTGDYTKKPYYQTILDSYGIAGDAAADDASASGAAANSGNLDSYAAANAQRQQLAFKNAAQSAALNAYNAEVASLLKTLGDLGVNVNDLYKTWASELDSQRSGAVNAYLGQLGADTDKYVSDNALAGDKYMADTNKYLGDLDLAGTKYQTDAQKYLGDLQAQIDKYKADAEVQINADKNAANKELAQLEITYNTTMADLDRKHELLKQEASTASAERIAQIEKEIREIEAEKEAATAKYKTDKALEESKYLADKEANSYLEGLKYNTTTGGEIEVKDPTTEEYNKAVEIYEAEGSAALEKYIASLARGKQELVRSYVEKYSSRPSGKTVSESDLQSIAAYANYAMKQGGKDAGTASGEAWVDFISKNPNLNTPENEDAVIEYLKQVFGK